VEEFTAGGLLASGTRILVVLLLAQYLQARKPGKSILYKSLNQRENPAVVKFLDGV
jgi:hypothetical protein